MPSVSWRFSSTVTLKSRTRDGITFSHRTAAWCDFSVTGVQINIQTDLGSNWIVLTRSVPALQIGMFSRLDLQSPDNIPNRAVARYFNQSCRSR